MKQMKRVLISFGFFILATPVAYACKPEIPSQPQAFRKAVAVFIGEVIDITESDVQPVKGQWYFVTVKFKVMEYWKGSGRPEIIVHSEQGMLSCNLFQFRRGEKYLVYASSRDLVVFTGSSRSSPLSRSFADDDLKALGKGKEPKPIRPS